jgi:hypothetical protein
MAEPSAWAVPARRFVVEALPLLAALAAVALLVDGDAVLAVSGGIAIVWALWVASRGPARAEAVSWPKLLVRLLPVLVAGAIAEALVSERWFPFTFAALAFALLIPWRGVLDAWERRRASREAS